MRRPTASTKKSTLKGPAEISFQRGLNQFQGNRLLLQDGESAELVNADFDVFGDVGILWPFTTLVSGLSGRVHSIYITDRDMFVGHGTALSHIDLDTNVVTAILTGLNGSDVSMFATDTWLFLTEGETHKKIWLSTLDDYEWGIDNPLSAPSAVSGAAGSPNGTYDLYYSYVAKYPDGTEYETDLSPMSQVAVSSAKIEWTYPATVSDSQITHIRLYRDKTGQTATLQQLRDAIEDRQTELEAATNSKIFSRLVQMAIRRATNKQVVDTMSTSMNTIVGPFQVGEVEVGDVGFSDNYSDAELVQRIPHLRERYQPIFGA